METKKVRKKAYIISIEGPSKKATLGILVSPAHAALWV